MQGGTAVGFKAIRFCETSRSKGITSSSKNATNSFLLLVVRPGATKLLVASDRSVRSDALFSSSVLVPSFLHFPIG